MEMNQTVSFFRVLTDPDIEEIKMLASKRLYTAGELVFSQGDEANSFYIIEKGQISVFYDNNGIDKELCTLSDNDYFGEMAIYNQDRRSA
ncbi:MAG: cyclic nucleotide-binding domain-containing protein, partial [Gammaproteobacteria bacterium]|nr:cyclic nucleotide-binding domain-containing protein [Gammaproteobacteria bacterium]